MNLKRLAVLTLTFVFITQATPSASANDWICRLTNCAAEPQEAPP